MLVSRPLKTIQPSGYQQNNRLQTCMFLHGFVFLHSKTLQTNDVQISIKKYVRHHYFGILRQCSPQELPVQVSHSERFECV